MVERYKASVAAENKKDDRRFETRQELRRDIMPRLSGAMQILLSIANADAPLAADLSKLRASYSDLDAALARQMGDFIYGFDITTTNDVNRLTMTLRTYYERLKEIQTSRNNDSLAGAIPQVRDVAGEVAGVITKLNSYEH